MKKRLLCFMLIFLLTSCSNVNTNTSTEPNKEILYSFYNDAYSVLNEKDKVDILVSSDYKGNVEFLREHLLKAEKSDFFVNDSISLSNKNIKYTLYYDKEITKEELTTTFGNSDSILYYNYHRKYNFSMNYINILTKAEYKEKQFALEDFPELEIDKMYLIRKCEDGKKVYSLKLKTSGPSTVIKSLYNISKNKYVEKEDISHYEIKDTANEFIVHIKPEYKSLNLKRNDLNSNLLLLSKTNIKSAFGLDDNCYIAIARKDDVNIKNELLNNEHVDYITNCVEYDNSIIFADEDMNIDSTFYQELNILSNINNIVKFNDYNDNNIYNYLIKNNKENYSLKIKNLNGQDQGYGSIIFSVKDGYEDYVVKKSDFNSDKIYSIEIYEDTGLHILDINKKGWKIFMNSDSNDFDTFSLCEELKQKNFFDEFYFKEPEYYILIDDPAIYVLYN